MSFFHHAQESRYLGERYTALLAIYFLTSEGNGETNGRDRDSTRIDLDKLIHHARIEPRRNLSARDLIEKHIAVFVRDGWFTILATDKDSITITQPKGVRL